MEGGDIHFTPHTPSIELRPELEQRWWWGVTLGLEE